MHVSEKHCKWPFLHGALLARDEILELPRTTSSYILLSCCRFLLPTGSFLVISAKFCYLWIFSQTHVNTFQHHNDFAIQKPWQECSGEDRISAILIQREVAEILLSPQWLLLKLSFGVSQRAECFLGPLCWELLRACNTQWTRGIASAQPFSGRGP